MRFKDKVVMITGGGQGIGREYCHAFAKEGAKVVVADIKEDNAERVAQECKDLGGEAIAVSVDISKEESVKNAVKTVENKYNKIDVLVNNASIFATIKMKPFDEISVEEWDKLMSVNVRGTWIVCKEVARVMKKQGRGKIVNIGSASMLLGKTEYLHYVTSKASLVGMTRAMAKELGQWNITVNLVMPGATFTEVERETVTEEQAQAMISKMCIKRKQVPEDLVGAIMFFSAEDSDLISGQSLCVDGGINFL